MKRFFVCMLAVGMAWAARAEVTLDSCRTWARGNYPAIEQYHLIEMSTDYSVKNAALAWVPRLTLSAQLTYQSETIDMSEVWGSLGLDKMLQEKGSSIPEMSMKPLQGKVALDLQQTIWDGGLSTAQKRKAQADAAAQTAQLDVDFYALESRVDDIFFGLLLLDEQHTQLESLRALLTANHERVLTLLANDALLPSDADAVEVEIISVDQKLTQVRYSRNAFRQMLSLLTGRNLLGETLQMPHEITSQSIVAAERPELRLIDAQISALDAQKKQLWATTMPQFAAFAQGWYGYPGLNMFKSMTSDGKWSLSGMVGVTMRWNISNYYTLSNSRKKIDLQREMLQSRRTLFSFNQDIARSQENSEVLRLQQVLQDDEKIVRLRTNVRQAAETKYENGTITTSELLQKITDETQAKSALALHRVELLKAQYKLSKNQ